MDVELRFQALALDFDHEKISQDQLSEIPKKIRDLLKEYGFQTLRGTSFGHGKAPEGWYHGPDEVTT